MKIIFNNVLLVGVLLFLLGIIVLSRGSFTVPQEETVAEVGVVKVTAEKEKEYKINPYISAFLIISGLAVMIASQSKPRV